LPSTGRRRLHSVIWCPIRRPSWTRTRRTFPRFRPDKPSCRQRKPRNRREPRPHRGTAPLPPRCCRGRFLGCFGSSMRWESKGRRWLPQPPSVATGCLGGTQRRAQTPNKQSGVANLLHDEQTTQVDSDSCLAPIGAEVAPVLHCPDHSPMSFGFVGVCRLLPIRAPRIEELFAPQLPRMLEGRGAQAAVSDAYEWFECVRNPNFAGDFVSTSARQSQSTSNVHLGKGHLK
jgi:hypothetical protein